MGAPVGTPSVTLTSFPPHRHKLTKKNIQGGAAAKVSTPDNRSNFGQLTSGSITYVAMDKGTASVPLSPDSLSTVWSVPVEPHENRQPFLALTYAIATDGEYPYPP